MKLIQYDPFEQMDEMFSHFPIMRGMSDMQKAFVPAMDVYEDGNNVVVETPLAGVDPKNVNVSVEKGVLTVQGQSKKEHEIDDKNYYKKEIRSGSFYRQVALPVHVKEDKIDAEFSDGVLKITCPKAEPKQAKKVSIKVKRPEKLEKLER